MFDGSTSDVEVQLEHYQSQRATVLSLATDAYQWSELLKRRLEEATKAARDVQTVLDYSASLEFLETKMNEVRAEEQKVLEVFFRRERRWILSIQYDQLGPDVEKVRIFVACCTYVNQSS